MELTESVAIGTSKATEVQATGAIHERELAADAASKGSTEIAAIGASKELTPVQVDSTSVQSIEIGVSGTSQESEVPATGAIDETLVFSGTDDPELAAAGASAELLVEEGFVVLQGPHTFEDRSRR